MTVYLSDVAAGIGGFKIIGEAASDVAGGAVAAVGDLNGDGIDDLLIGAYRNDAAGYNAGAAYVVFGKADGLAIDLDDVAAGISGFKIIGEAQGDRAGISVAAAGDLNGDGLGDLLIGAKGNDAGGSDAGATYVVFGKADGLAVNLDNVAAGIGGFKIIGEVKSDRAGNSVAGVGDLNGDGFGDFLIGAPDNDAGGSNAGAAYVVFGKADGLAVNLDNVAAGIGGFKIIGEAAGDYTGYPVSAAGDINGDGIGDLLIGAEGNDTGGRIAGAVYVVFGKADGLAVDLTDVAAGVGGFKIIGEAEIDLAGSPAAAGDLNGDGLGDLLIGVRLNDAGGRYSGAAYVVFGKADGTPVNLDDVAAGHGGFKIIGETPGDGAGVSVAAAGDLNGDGIGDLLIGASGNDAARRGAGAVYVVFGKADGLAVDLADVAAGHGGVKIIGEAADDRAGISVAAAGDLDGDGLGDLLIGAKGNDAGGNQAGAAYVVFGRDILHPTGDSLVGSAGNDTLTGNVGNDTFKGLDGDDSLSGDHGRDSILGHSGNDTLIGNQQADTLRGQDGNDVLWGGNGADRLIGEAGDDTMTGGDGADRFIFRHEQATDGVIDHDVITDYDPLRDVIDLKAGVAVEDHDVIGGNLVLTLTGGDQVELQGITTFADVVFI